MPIVTSAQFRHMVMTTRPCEVRIVCIVYAGKHLGKIMETVIFAQIYRWRHLYGTMQTWSVLLMQANVWARLCRQEYSQRSIDGEVCTAQCRQDCLCYFADSDICTAQYIQDYIYYLWRQMSALLHMDKSNCMDLCWRWHLQLCMALGKQVCCAFMQTNVGTA